MTAEFEHSPILTVPVPVARMWNQDLPGGCRCLCQIYHRGVGVGGCTRAAEPGLLIRLEVTERDATAPDLAADLDRPMPVCGCCYRLLAVPNTPVAVLREGLDATIARHGTRFEAAAVALLADTGLLDHLGIRRHITDDTYTDNAGNSEHIVRLAWWALIGSTEHLGLDLSQERVLELALSLTRGEPVDLGDALLDLDPRHCRPVADALAIALGLDTTTRDATPTTPGEPTS
ncbi:DUF6372 family protein [Nocardia sp. NPDC058176]|uniref:DUF6372 family protein n=1 Tax=Nocardia sp. NPDC058176 TaxID=3346368 RepID=UPI0036DE1A42